MRTVERGGALGEVDRRLSVFKMEESWGCVYDFFFFSCPLLSKGMKSKKKKKDTLHKEVYLIKDVQDTLDEFTDHPNVEKEESIDRKKEA